MLYLQYFDLIPIWRLELVKNNELDIRNQLDRFHCHLIDVNFFQLHLFELGAEEISRKHQLT